MVLQQETLFSGGMGSGRSIDFFMHIKRSLDELEGIDLFSLMNKNKQELNHLGLFTFGTYLFLE